MTKLFNIFIVFGLGIALSACAAVFYDDPYYGGPDIIGVGAGMNVW